MQFLAIIVLIGVLHIAIQITKPKGDSNGRRK